MFKRLASRIFSRPVSQSLTALLCLVTGYWAAHLDQSLLVLLAWVILIPTVVYLRAEQARRRQALEDYRSFTVRLLLEKQLEGLQNGVQGR